MSQQRLTFFLQDKSNPKLRNLRTQKVIAKLSFHPCFHRRWRKCPNCDQMIQAFNLKGPCCEGPIRACALHLWTHASETAKVRRVRRVLGTTANLSGYQSLMPTIINKGVCHKGFGLAIYIKKYYLKAKEEELCKLKYLFHHAKNIIFKKSSKRNQNPSRYYNSN